MKKIYEKPFIISHSLENAAIPVSVIGGLSMAAGYAIGRAVASGMKALPIIKLKEIK